MKKSVDQAGSEQHARTAAEQLKRHVRLLTHRKKRRSTHIIRTPFSIGSPALSPVVAHIYLGESVCPSVASALTLFSLILSQSHRSCLYTFTVVVLVAIVIISTDITISVILIVDDSKLYQQ